MKNDKLETNAEYKWFEITLTAKGDIHTATILQKVDGKRTVPGPTLKGALRNAIEKRIIELFKSRGVHVPHDMRPCIPATQVSEGEEREIQDKFYAECCRYEEDSDYRICPVCYLLGAQGLVGFVTVPFLCQNPRSSDVFEGSLQVLWKDRQKGWSFGDKRGDYDKWLPHSSPEAILNDMVVERLKSIRWLGSQKGPLAVSITIRARSALGE